MRIPSKLKVLPLSIGLVALLALSAGVAWAGSPGEFRAAEYPVEVKGENTNNHVFKTKEGKVTCTTAKFSGEAKEDSTSIEISAEYEGCTAFGFNATVDMNGCKYKFHAEAEIENSNPKEHEGSADVIDKPERDCATEPITITVDGDDCTVTVGPQTGLEDVTYKNIENETEVEVRANITEIEYTQENCKEDGTFNDGTYKGPKANEEAKATVMGVEPGTTNKIDIEVF